MAESTLIIDGVPAARIAGSVGTPVIVYSQSQIENRLREFTENFRSDRLRTKVVYASKAFACGAMLELVKNAGCGLDVVSGGEMHLAKISGFPMDNVLFHGNNKTPAEICEALHSGCGTFVIDNRLELRRLISYAKDIKRKCRALIRINPHISAHTHSYIMTADLDSKFGISIDRKEEIFAMIEELCKSGYVEFTGFHAHIGSQIFEKDAYAGEIDTMAELISLTEKKGHRVKCLDIGGGFAAYYTSEDCPIPVPEVCQAIISACHSAMDKYAITLETLMIEPGRSITAEAGTTLYTVGGTKNTHSKKYVFVDGGMCDNIRPALYGAKYRCDLAEKMDRDKTETVTVAGKCCESGDILIHDIPLPPAEPGDILAVYTTGAYGYSMASNYNRIGRPAVVFAKDGKARCVIRRETYEDLDALECNRDIEF
jgi:diaminopimelate decarboxylase